MIASTQLVNTGRATTLFTKQASYRAVARDLGWMRCRLADRGGGKLPRWIDASRGSISGVHRRSPRVAWDAPRQL